MRCHRMTLKTIAAALLCCVGAGSTGGKASFKGRMAAYRPADRLAQVVSFVANREVFLFRVNGGEGKILKLVYVHQGYSDIKDDVLHGSIEISVAAHRDRSCDQTLESFEKDAPTVPIQGDSGAVIEPIVFADKSLRLEKSYMLNCYVLDRWQPLATEHR